MTMVNNNFFLPDSKSSMDARVCRCVCTWSNLLVNAGELFWSLNTLVAGFWALPCLHCLAKWSTVEGMHLCYTYSITYQTNLPNFCVNSSSTFSRVENLEYEGLGKHQRNLWVKPISALADCSIRVRATDGWLKPPTVRLVVSISKLASPDTGKIKLIILSYHCFFCILLIYIPGAQEVATDSFNCTWTEYNAIILYM